MVQSSQHMVLWKRYTHPQIPVLLIAMVTSPSFNACPLFTSSTLGPLSSTHNLCSGLQYTPMFGLVADGIAVGVASNRIGLYVV